MLRKLSLVVVAAASLGVAALAPTSASAHWHGGWHHHHGWHHGWHHHHHGGWGWGGPRFFAGGPGFGYGGEGCLPRLVPTPWGPRLVNRCY
jgi:hypothetical protein